MNIEYRLMTIEDYEQAYDLWILCGNGLNNKDDSREGIDRYLKRNPTTSFVAVCEEKVVGVILCGHDGRRGIIQHACVSPRRTKAATSSGNLRDSPCVKT